MKKVFVFLFLITNSFTSFCQNLIIDGGIDNNSNCPIECGSQYLNYTLANNTYYWKSSFLAAGYFHYCGDTTICLPRLWHGIPYNCNGFEHPLSDSGYAHVYAGNGFISDRRGFVYQKMRQNLIPTKKENYLLAN